MVEPEIRRVYLRAYETPRGLERGVAHWFERYNGYRPHAALDGLTPDQQYAGERPRRAA